MSVLRPSLKWVLFALALAARPAVSAEPIEASVIHIEVGYVAQGAFIKVEEGTGFLVHPSGWVLTARHVVEAAVPADRLRAFRGAARSSTATPNELFAVPTSVVAADVGLLRFSPLLRADWPALKVKANHVFRNSDKVTALGFPSGADMSVRPGAVTALSGPNGTIGVNVGLAPGMSGGPIVLSGTRCVVAISVGGSGDPTFDYVIPIQYAKTLLDVPPADFVTDVAGTGSEGVVQSPLFDRSYTVNETKDDHSGDRTSKEYGFDFNADPGSTIVSARYLEGSANNVSDKVLNINPERTAVNFKFRLASGPVYDRWRGWWEGQVILTEQRATSPQTASKCD